VKAARAKPKRQARPRGRSRTRTKSKKSKWLAFVKRHGIVLASARGPLPSVADAVAGEPIAGSWWAHPKGKAIFAALCELDDSVDVRSFKLVGGKITLVHRRLWPALVRLAQEGALPAERVASLQQEHLPTGEHRNIIMPFPGWVDDETSAAAAKLSLDQARAALGLEL
jgi:hypothetical protein